jgi:hypothetical protein
MPTAQYCICVFIVSETVRSAYICVLSPPPSEVWAGYERKGKPSLETESLMHPSPVRCTLQSVGRSLKKICTVSRSQNKQAAATLCCFLCANMAAPLFYKMAFSGGHNSCYFLLLKYKYGHSFLL